MDIAQLGLEIRSDGVVVATDRLKKLDQQAAHTNRTTDMLVKAFGALAAAFSVSALIRYTNTWTDLNSRVEIATGSIGKGAATMSRLSDMARRTYSSLELTAETFLRNATAMRDLGYNTSETLDYVEAINNALVVSGAKGERAESVMNALGKAMALGKLSGDQLETVLASGGRITEALAASLGVTTLELRKLGTEGKLTGDVIYEALTGQLQLLREEADSMPATIGDAFVLLNNSVLQAVGAFDQMTAASSKAAEGIIWVADNLELFAPILSGVAAVIAVALVPALGSAAAATWALTAALLANPLTWVALAIGAVVAGAVLLIQRMGGVEEAFLAVQQTATDVWERIKAGGQSLSDVMQGVALMIQGAFMRAWAGIAEGFANLVSSMGGAAGMLGLDASGATAFAKALHTQAAAYEAGSQISFGNAANNWGKATGPGAAMDNVGVGASWSGVQDMFGANSNEMPGTPRAGSVGGGTAKANPYADLVRGAKEFIAAQELEAQALGMTEEAASRLRHEQDLLNKAANDNINLTPQQANELTGLASAMAAAEETARRAKDAFDFTKGAVKGFLSDLRGALNNGASFWDAFGQAGMNVLDKIINKVEDQLVDALFSLGGMGGGGGGGIFGWIGSLFGFARGGVFSGGHLQAFAQGGIVNGPTLFPMANGAGLMGEAGPEAIMPLRRGADGKLGVAANSNGGGSMHVSVGVTVDDEGKLLAYVKSISRHEAQTAAAAGTQVAVAQANKTAPASVAKYQQQRAGSDYRTM